MALNTLLFQSAFVLTLLYFFFITMSCIVETWSITFIDHNTTQKHIWPFILLITLHLNNDKNEDQFDFVDDFAHLDIYYGKQKQTSNGYGLQAWYHQSQILPPNWFETKFRIKGKCQRHVVFKIMTFCPLNLLEFLYYGL